MTRWSKKVNGIAIMTIYYHDVLDEKYMLGKKHRLAVSLHK